MIKISNIGEKSKYWDTMVDILDVQFPKRKCRERGKAMLMLAYIDFLIMGMEFKDGRPLK